MTHRRMESSTLTFVHKVEPEDRARANFYGVLAALYADAPSAPLLRAIAYAEPLPVAAAGNLPLAWNRLLDACRVMDPDALVEALRGGKVRAAGLDVTEPEPLPDSSPLWKLENVIITPHSAGDSDGSRRRVRLLVRENLRRFALGEPLLNVVDKEQWY